MHQRTLLILLVNLALYYHGSKAITHSPQGSHSHMKHQHKHYDPAESKEDSLLEDTQFVRDKQHLKEELPSHLSEEDVDNMSPQEAEFQYFKIHDLDENNLLDGLEILLAVNHVSYETAVPLEGLTEFEKQNELLQRRERFDKRIDDVSRIIDTSIKRTDLNDDGYISYAEFSYARRTK